MIMVIFEMTHIPGGQAWRVGCDLVRYSRTCTVIIYPGYRFHHEEAVDEPVSLRSRADRSDQFFFETLSQDECNDDPSGTW